MTKKETLKNELLLAMKPHLDAGQMAILETAMSEALYNVDVVDMQTLPATQDMTNEYILALYQLKKGPRLSEKTMQGYMQGFRDFSRYIDKNFLQVTQEDVEHYLHLKHKEGNTNVSLNNKRRKLSALFEWMRKYGLIVKSPVEGIEKFKETSKPIDHMDAVEFDQLKCGCKTKRDRALVEWLRCTAMRKSEIPEVRINQVNWQEGKLLIYGSKGDAYRTVCLDGLAIKYLKEYLDERGVDIHSSQPLFTWMRGDKTRALSGDGIYAEVKRIAAASGLDRKVYPHLFRKTTATNIVRRGGTDADAGDYLGHKPQNVTSKHYTYKSEEHTTKIFEAFVASV